MNNRIQPVAKSTLADEVAQRVAEMIQQGDFEPGDQLPTINEMASRFGVGHPTLREALKKLEALGTVKVKHGSGVYVESNQEVLLMSNPIFRGDVSKDMMVDLIEARIPVELKSVERAARNATEEDIEELDELLDEAEQNLDDDSVLNKTNMAFHRKVALTSGNMVMAQLLEVLSNLFEREQLIMLDMWGDREKDLCEHRAILEALRKGDEGLARARMRDHLEGVREMIQQWDPEETPLS